jgi:hypothetical protein
MERDGNMGSEQSCHYGSGSADYERLSIGLTIVARRLTGFELSALEVVANILDRHVPDTSTS